MIEIGTLVKYKNHPDIGIVINHWIDDKSGAVRGNVVKWISGGFVGVSSEYNEDLEVIA